MVKKAASIFILTIFFSCVDKPKNASNDCLVDHDWCLPNCENPELAWKFSSDGTFNFSSTLLGGNSAWGTWIDLDNKKIELKYTRNTTKKKIPNQVIDMPDCRTLNIGGVLYKR